MALRTDNRCAAVAVATLAVSASMTLQGCEIARHHVGNWQQKTSYLTTYMYIPPGTEEGQLNSCSSPDAALAVKCSGHGICQEWFAPDLTNYGGNIGNTTAPKPLTFCKCDRYWTDPECRTERKSQYVAFYLSLFLGVFGVDQLYLGFRLQAVLKLLSLGGAGFWYIYDVMRIGSSKVFTAERFQVADDLSHFVFVLSVLAFFGFLGFFISVQSISRNRCKKARELMIAQAEIPAASIESAPAGPGLYASRSSIAPPTVVNPAATPPPPVQFTGYGSTVSRPLVKLQPSQVIGTSLLPGSVVPSLGSVPRPVSSYVSAPIGIRD